MPIHNKFLDHEYKAIAHMWGNGLSDSDIAKKLNRGDATIKRARKKLGINRNHAMTKEKLERIKELNEQGKTDLEISHITGISRKYVGIHRKRMRLKVIHYGGTKSFFNKELTDKIAIRRRMGASTRVIAKELGCTSQSVRHNLVRLGSENLSLRDVIAHIINEECFSQITDASAYWLGFLMADGCNLDGIAISIAVCDREHLEKLKRYCKYEGPIRIIKCAGRKMLLGRQANVTDQVCIRSHSMKISADLAKWGIVPNKSLIAKAHPLLAVNRHFWRGVIDGDGSISQRRNTTLTLCGSENIVNQFADYIESITGHRPIIRDNINIKATAVYGDNARTMLKLLYTDCEYYLDRKMALAQMHMAAKFKRTKLLEETRRQIHELKASGLSGHKIAKILGIHYVTAYAHIRQNAASLR